MACFLVSAAETAIVTVTEKAVEKNGAAHVEEAGVPFTQKLKRLSNMLWGGMVLVTNSVEKKTLPGGSAVQ